MADPLTEEIALFDWLRAQCAWEAGQDRAERLAAGEPFEVPRYRFGGHSIPRDDGWPAWLLDHFEGVRSVRVYADDTVAPWSEHPCHPPPAYTTYGPFLKAASTAGA